MNIGHASKKIAIPAHSQSDIQHGHNQFFNIRSVNCADESLSSKSLSSKIGNFIKKHPLLTAVATGAALMTGLVCYKTLTDAATQATADVGVTQALVGAQTIPQDENHALAIHSKVGEEIKLCTGSALSNDVIITTASCVSHLDTKLHKCTNDNGTDVDIADYYGEFGESVEVGNETYISDYDNVPDNGIRCESSEIFIKLPAKNVTVFHNEKQYKAKKIIAHSNFNMSFAGLHNNIALIKLRDSIPNVPTVKLPTETSNTELRAEIIANGNGTNPAYPNNLFTQGWLIGKKNATGSANIRYEKGNWEIKQTSVHTFDFIDEFNAAFEQHHINCDQLLCAESSTANIQGSDMGAPVFHQHTNQTKSTHLAGVAAQSLVFNFTAPLNRTHDIIKTAHKNFGVVNVDVYQNKKWIETTKKELDAHSPTTAIIAGAIIAGTVTAVGIAAGATLAAKKLCRTQAEEPDFTVNPSLAALIMQEEA